MHYSATGEFTKKVNPNPKPVTNSKPSPVTKKVNEHFQDVNGTDDINVNIENVEMPEVIGADENVASVVAPLVALSDHDVTSVFKSDICDAFLKLSQMPVFKDHNVQMPNYCLGNNNCGPKVSTVSTVSTVNNTENTVTGVDISNINSAEISTSTDANTITNVPLSTSDAPVTNTSKPVDAVASIEAFINLNSGIVGFDKFELNYQQV